MILISNDFWHKIKIDNFDRYNVLLSIATDILQTGFVLQSHVYHRVCCVFEIRSALILESCILPLVSHKNSSGLTIGHIKRFCLFSFFNSF